MSSTDIAACVVLRIAMSNIYNAIMYFDSLQHYPIDARANRETLDRGMITWSGLLCDRYLHVRDVIAVATNDQVSRLQEAGRSSGFWVMDDEDIPGTIFMYTYIQHVIDIVTG